MTSTVIEGHKCHFYVNFNLYFCYYGQLFVPVLLLTDGFLYVHMYMIVKTTDYPSI